MGQYPERVVFLQRFQARQAPDVATPGCRRGQLDSGFSARGRSGRLLQVLQLLPEQVAN